MTALQYAPSYIEAPVDHIEPEHLHSDMCDYSSCPFVTRPITDKYLAALWADYEALTRYQSTRIFDMHFLCRPDCATGLVTIDGSYKTSDDTQAGQNGGRNPSRKSVGKNKFWAAFDTWKAPEITVVPEPSNL